MCTWEVLESADLGWKQRRIQGLKGGHCGNRHALLERDGFVEGVDDWNRVGGTFDHVDRKDSDAGRASKRERDGLCEEEKRAEDRCWKAYSDTWSSAGGEREFLRNVRSLVGAREAQGASTHFVTDIAAFDGEANVARGFDYELCLVRHENLHPNEERIRELFNYNEWVLDARTNDDKQRVDVIAYCRGGADNTTDTSRGQGKVLD